MRTYTVVIEPAATDDIRTAYLWYKNENPVAAEAWPAGIESAILKLEITPAARSIAPESVAFEREIRCLFYGRSRRWCIFFTIEGDRVHVLHVRHGARDTWREEY